MTDTQATLVNVDISGNGAADVGGGIAIDGGNVILQDVWVNENLTQYAGGAGVAVAGDATLVNVLIARNTAGGVGDAPSGCGGISTGGGSVTLTNVTLVDNRISAGPYDMDGGGICAWGGWLDLDNVIVAGNVATGSGGGLAVDGAAVTVEHSAFWGNVPDAVYGIADPTGLDGNVSVDPVFVDDGHLDAASPLIDAGDPAIVDPDGSPSDLGAFGGPGAGGFDLDGDGWYAWWLPGAWDAATSPDRDCDDADPTVHPGAGC